MYNKYEIGPYNIHLINTDKFKTISVSINFKSLLKKEEITYRNLLILYLTTTMNKYKTKRDLDIKTEELYNLSYDTDSSLSGNYSVMQLLSRFLNDKYTEAGMNEESFKFIFDFVFDPHIKNNSFDETSFKLAKNMLIEKMDSIEENHQKYALTKLYESLGADTNLKYRSVGYKEDLDSITPISLYEYYLKVLKSDIIDIFVIGDFDNDVIKNMIIDNFRINTIKKNTDSHFIVSKKIRSKEKVITEKKDIYQSVLTIGYKVDELTDWEKKYVAIIYNYILGGGADSKLFREVREKNSLCYSVFSSISVVSSVLIIISGIDSSNLKKALRLIKKEVKNMANGDFSLEDIEKAKLTVLSTYAEIEDSSQAIITTYMAKEYLGFDELDVRKKEIVKVTKEDIIKLAKKVHIDTVFVLERGEV